MAHPEVSRGTRLGVYLFLLVFAVTGVAHLEVFPFSGFKLFSEVRGSERASWQLRAVDATGEETPIVLRRLPRGARHTTSVLDQFSQMTPAERDEVCAEWAASLDDEAATKDGREVAALRVYRLVVHVNPHGPPPQRTLAYECAGAIPADRADA